MTDQRGRGNFSYRMTPEQLARLLAAVAAAQDAQEERNRVIAALHGEGVSLRDIARELGMTHPGIRKIVQKTQQEADNP